jgi:predicted lipoprotein with Yx(FWY)xxD motif
MSHEPGNTLTTRAPRQQVQGVARVRRTVVAVVGVAAVVIVASASTTAFAAGSTVDVATTSNFGTVLVDTQGFALYTFPQDHNGISACTGPCIPVWPALTVPAGTTPRAGTGVTGTVAAVLQSNSTYQVTYNGSPLYTFVGDTKPGQVSGQNIGGFTVVQVSGSSTTPTTAAPAPTTGSTSPTTPTPTAPPAASTPTTRPPATAVVGAPAPSPAAAAASSGATPAPASSSSPAASTAPTSLAFTGPGPGLIWMMVIGSVLIALSVTGLMLLGIDASRD